MAEHKAKTFHPRISDRIGDVLEFNWTAEFGEILVVGYEGTAVLTASGELGSTRSLPADVKIIGQQRTPQGWQVLVRENSALSILFVQTDGLPDVSLNCTLTDPHTARWSPCGNLVAVGSIGTDLSVWNTTTGLQKWKRSIVWDTDEFLTPPELSIQGWSRDGKRIITTAEYLASHALNVWDADSGEVLAFVD